MDLDQAIAKHAEWKFMFRSAIFKKETLDVNSIARDDCCELGKWLHLEAKAKFGDLST